MWPKASLLFNCCSITIISFVISPVKHYIQYICIVFHISHATRLHYPAVAALGGLPHKLTKDCGDFQPWTERKALILCAPPSGVVAMYRTMKTTDFSLSIKMKKGLTRCTHATGCRWNKPRNINSTQSTINIWQCALYTDPPPPPCPLTLRKQSENDGLTTLIKPDRQIGVSWCKHSVPDWTLLQDFRLGVTCKLLCDSLRKKLIDRINTWSIVF